MRFTIPKYTKHPTLLHYIVTKSLRRRGSVILTLGQEAGLRRVKPCSWSVYRSSSSPSGTPLSPCASAAAAAASDAEATGSCGHEAGRGRSSAAADTALRVRTGGWEGEGSHLGATARARCGRRRWRPASASGGPQRGETSDIGISSRGYAAVAALPRRSLSRFDTDWWVL